MKRNTDPIYTHTHIYIYIYILRIYIYIKLADSVLLLQKFRSLDRHLLLNDAVQFV